MRWNVAAINQRAVKSFERFFRLLINNLFMFCYGVLSLKAKVMFELLMKRWESILGLCNRLNLNFKLGRWDKRALTLKVFEVHRVWCKNYFLFLFNSCQLAFATKTILRLPKYSPHVLKSQLKFTVNNLKNLFFHKTEQVSLL